MNSQPIKSNEIAGSERSDKLYTVFQILEFAKLISFHHHYRIISI